MHQQEQNRVNPWTVWIPIILIALGSVVFYNYLIYVQQQRQGEDRERPPFIHRAEGDLILTERSGRTVRLSELRGQIIFASWVFTRCPRGCAGVVAEMKKLWQEVKDRDDVHFIAFALDPEDSPEMLAAFADQLEIPKDANWWFVQGDEVKLRQYMTRQLRFRPVQPIAEEDRLNPNDKFMHDLRVVLIDHRGNIRRLADLVNADPEVAQFWREQIRKDLDFVTKEKNAP
jgi:cytochrome oxidase Cu insertion factor (SCO1/SenC/PrrC family)